MNKPILSLPINLSRLFFSRSYRTNSHRLPPQRPYDENFFLRKEEPQEEPSKSQTKQNRGSQFKAIVKPHEPHPPTPSRRARNVLEKKQLQSRKSRNLNERTDTPEPGVKKMKANARKKRQMPDPSEGKKYAKAVAWKLRKYELDDEDMYNQNEEDGGHLEGEGYATFRDDDHSNDDTIRTNQIDSTETGTTEDTHQTLRQRYFNILRA
jgi:hypothetical protein